MAVAPFIEFSDQFGFVSRDHPGVACGTVVMAVLGTDATPLTTLKIHGQITVKFGSQKFQHFISVWSYYLLAINSHVQSSLSGCPCLSHRFRNNVHQFAEREVYNKSLSEEEVP